MPNLKKRLPFLNTLVAFDAAFRLNSFTKAANELSLSQASISRQIRQLEQKLGVQLFERQRYNVIPTEAGKKLAPTIANSLRDIAQACDQVRPDNPTESFTILVDLGLGNSLIAPNIGEYQALHPNVKFRILSTAEPIESVSEQFDVGLQNGRWAEDRFKITAIADDQIFPVCSPEILKQLPDQCHPSDLTNHPLFHLSQTGRDWPNWQLFFNHFGVDWSDSKHSTEFGSYTVCLDATEKNGGIALGWAHSVQQRIMNGSLVRIPGMSMKLKDDLCVYTDRSKKEHPLVKSFSNFIQNKITPLKL